MLRKGANDRLAYFYATFSDDESLDPVNILGSILAQLCNPNNIVYGRIGKLYDDKVSQNFGKIPRLGTGELVDLIFQMTNDDHQTFIFLDALNECGDPYVALSCIESLLAFPRARIKICLSSINERGIVDYLLRMPNLLTKTLNQGEMRNDIDVLVRASLEEHPRLSQHSAQLKDEIIWALTRGAQGMYVIPHEIG